MCFFASAAWSTSMEQAANSYSLERFKRLLYEDSSVRSLRPRRSVVFLLDEDMNGQQVGKCSSPEDSHTLEPIRKSLSLLGGLLFHSPCILRSIWSPYRARSDGLEDYSNLIIVFNIAKSRSTNNICLAGQPMVLDQRWAAADSGPGQSTETLSPPE